MTGELMFISGQLAKVVRECRREGRTRSAVTSHIKIPADYKSGIILAIDQHSSAFNLLHQCPELPLLEPNNDLASAF